MSATGTVSMRTHYAAGCPALPWEVWTASGPQAWVSVHHDNDELTVTVQELGDEGGPRPHSLSRIVLDREGSCRVSQVASPSVVHFPNDGGPPSWVPGDGAHAQCRVEVGDVLVQTTPAMLEGLPPGALLVQASGWLGAGIQSASGTFLREASGHDSGDRAAVAVIKHLPAAHLR